MPTQIEQELGLVTTTNRIRRWFRRFVPEGERGVRFASTFASGPNTWRLPTA